MFTWKTDKHGLCEVDMVFKLWQIDRVTKKVTIKEIVVSVAKQFFQDCEITKDVFLVEYKIVAYLIKNGNRVQITKHVVPKYHLLQGFTTKNIFTEKDDRKGKSEIKSC